MDLLCWMQEGRSFLFLCQKSPQRQEQTSVELLLLQAGKLCGSFGWKWAELQPFSCCLPYNLCSFPGSHLHCQKWATSRLPLAGLLSTGLLPSRQGRALPGPAWDAGSSLLSLCPVPAGCSAWMLSFAFIFITVPNPVITAVCVSPENLCSGLVGVVREQGVFSDSNLGLKYTDF